MAVGRQPTRAEIDAEAGGIARDIFALLGRASAFKAWLDGKTDDELAAPSIGYGVEEIATLRAAFDDVGVILAAFSGEAPLAQPRDFRSELRRLFGF